MVKNIQKLQSIVWYVIKNLLLSKPEGIKIIAQKNVDIKSPLLKENRIILADLRKRIIKLFSLINMSIVNYIFGYKNILVNLMFVVSVVGLILKDV